ncbi:MAG: shikimate dehydrogenase [Deltaproteobacteria bacterium]|nr:shikimate dehydrogenase [Deltaproteobacteria bacterium]
MHVRATTKVFGIFGHPVNHSLSPTMHNAAFKKLKLDRVYIAFDIHPKNLDSATQAIKSLGILGVNVTIPHKEKILSFLDETSPEVEMTGAVNTVKNENGKLIGYNTDVEGFLMAIKEDLGVIPKGLRISLLGAGGAARAVLTGLCMNGASEIYLINRTLDKAKKLASEFKRCYKDISIGAYALEDRVSVERSLRSAELLINASSSGMEGVASSELRLEVLPKESMVYDLVYKPRETPLLKAAKELGLKSAGGLSMLLYQGAKSFEIWTGKKAPVDVMRKAIE